MKKTIVIVIGLLLMLAACGPKPYYKTAKGKKKQKHYNEIQFGGKGTSQMNKKKKY